MEVISGLLKGERIRKTGVGTWEPKEILKGTRNPPGRPSKSCLK